MSKATPPTEQVTGCHRPPYRLGQSVVLVPIADGTARLFDLQGQLFALSEVAAQMLCDILELGPDGAAGSVARRWAVDVDVVKADLKKFLADLLRQGLLVPADQPARPPRLRERLVGMALSALVRLTCGLRPTLQGKAAGLLTVGHLSCRWLGWAKTVSLWQRLFPRPERPLQGPAAGEAWRAIDEVVPQAVAQSVLSPACMERGLTSWALARRAGLAPQLVIGLALYPLHAHCWTQLGTTYLGDDRDRCTEYQPVLTYD
jgi:Transglutaminase-like superfamily